MKNSPEALLMAVPIRIASNAQTIEAGSPGFVLATRVGPALSYRALVLKEQHCYRVSSVSFEKAALLPGFPVLVLKNEHCCGDSSVSFEKATLLRRFQC